MNDLCLVCKRRPYARGLCGPCYRNARKRIARGEASDAQLVKVGLMLPRQGVGKFGANAFSEAFKRQRAGEVKP
jgi:hypothetical protein